MSRKKQSKVGQNKSEVVREIPMACADEAAAVEFMEKRRWGDCPCCPECGSVNVYRMMGNDGNREKNYRWRCRDCDKRYTVRNGTVFEDSRVPLRHWCYAFWAACSSKKGVSALQIQRQTGVSYKTALFMMHRIRYAMTDVHNQPPKLNGTVEVDETYVGGKPRHKGWKHGQKSQPRAKYTSKTPVVAMVQRDGQVRARVMPTVNAANLSKCMREHIELGADLMTDESYRYRKIGPDFKSHQRVNHSQGEYARGEVTTNTVEGFFSLLKRGVYGTFHAVSKQHLHRYVSEFEFRYNSRKMDDGARTELAIQSAVGKRLTYRPLLSSAQARTD